MAACHSSTKIGGKLATRDHREALPEKESPTSAKRESAHGARRVPQRTRRQRMRVRASRERERGSRRALSESAAGLRALPSRSSGLWPPRFYLPGVAVREYAQDERVEIKVNKLTSTKTQLVRSARKNESIAASACCFFASDFRILPGLCCDRSRTTSTACHFASRRASSTPSRTSARCSTARSSRTRRMRSLWASRTSRCSAGSS